MRFAGWASDMSNADDLRAMMLQIGRERAAIEPRGYDSIRKRAELAQQWDDLYEEYLLERMVEDDPQTATATDTPTP